MTQPVERTQGTHFTLGQFGAMPDWKRFQFQHPVFPVPVRGKHFLQEPLGLTGMEISLNVLPPGRGMPFLHKHRSNEEVYVFLRGKGQFQIDGQVLEVHEGSVVRVAPEGSRAWRNHGTEELVYLVIQAKAATLTEGTTTDGVEVPGPVVWPGE